MPARSLMLWLLFQHCVAIVHVPGRRPFSQNLVHVYKDGQLVQTAPLRCPSLSEVCHAGFGEALGSWGILERVKPGAPVFPPPLPCRPQPSASGVCAAVAGGGGGLCEDLDAGGTSGFAVT